MNHIVRKKCAIDPEELGYQTMRECKDIERAKIICGLLLASEEDAAQGDIDRLNSDAADSKYQRSSLHHALYERPNPIDDRQMLAYRRKLRILLVMTVLSALGCLTGNIATFALLGLGLLIAIFCGLGLSALAVVVGHLFHEWVISRSCWLKVGIAFAITVLFFSGLFIFTQARSAMMDRVASTHPQNSYVDGEDEANASVDPPTHASSDSEIRRTMGEGMLLMMLAADLALAFLIGWLIEMYTDRDFISWTTLQELTNRIAELEEQIVRTRASSEINRKRCLAGILRAHNDIARHHPPYHRGLTLLLTVVFLFAHRVWAQGVHYEAILLDMSGSISRGDSTNELFRQYLVATKKLLLTEPPNSRIWVLAISSDSFGGTHEVLKGWTPEAHGLFTDDLDSARRELSARFEAKLRGSSPVAPRTDIFGALWRVKTLFESDKAARLSEWKEIWIFSDMMNDTKNVPMPKLVEFGQQQVLKRANAQGVVQLKSYKLHACGVSTDRMSPKEWTAVKEFWTAYFNAAGAILIAYSADVDCQR